MTPPLPLLTLYLQLSRQYILGQSKNVSIHTDQIPSCHNQRQISVNQKKLSRKTRRTLAQLRAGKSPVLMAYLNAIDPKSYPSPACLLCNFQKHTTQHLFSCSKINTTLTIQDLWNNPVAVAALLQQWYDVQSAAGGGPGSSLS